MYTYISVIIMTVHLGGPDGERERERILSTPFMSALSIKLSKLFKVQKSSSRFAVNLSKSFCTEFLTNYKSLQSSNADAAEALS